MIRIFLLSLLAIFGSCSSEKHAGNASETTNHIAGALSLQNGNPASNARVVLFQLSGKPDTATQIDVQKTNTSGEFLFESLLPGRYALEAEHESSGTRWLQSQIESVAKNSDQFIEGSLDSSAWLHVTTPNIPDSLGHQWSLVINDVLEFPIQSTTDTILEVPSGFAVVRILVAESSQGVAGVWAKDSLSLSKSDTTDLGVLSPWTPAEMGASPFLLDDFEDGNFWAPFESSWWLFSDNKNGGTSFVEKADPDSMGVDSPGFGGSMGAVHFRYTFGTRSPVFLGFGIQPKPVAIHQLIDLSGIDTVFFALKGSGSVHLAVCSSSDIVQKKVPSCLSVTDTLPAEWTEYRIPWRNFADTIEPEHRILAKDLTLMLTPIDGGDESGEVWVDNMGLIF